MNNVGIRVAVVAHDLVAVGHNRNLQIDALPWLDGDDKVTSGFRFEVEG